MLPISWTESAYTNCGLWRTLTGYLDFLKDPNFKCGFEFGLTLHMSTTRDLLACCHALNQLCSA